MVKNPGDWVRSQGQEDPLEQEMATHSAFLPRGQRSLVGYSPRGCRVKRDWAAEHVQVPWAAGAVRVLQRAGCSASSHPRLQDALPGRAEKERKEARSSHGWVGSCRPGECISQRPIFPPFHTVHGFSRQEYEVVCHSLLQWTTFCQTSPPWPVCLGWPHTAWLIVSLS